MVNWLSLEVECSACRQHSTVVLGTKIKEEKPIAQCPLCKSDQMKILSVTPKEASKQ
jgi:Zn finger protein HypA/HybF involved in hydrogenase expression